MHTRKQTNHDSGRRYNWRSVRRLRAGTQVIFQLEDQDRYCRAIALVQSVGPNGVLITLKEILSQEGTQFEAGNEFTVRPAQLSHYGRSRRDQPLSLKTRQGGTS